jgi:DNA replication protein DnaC
VERHRKTATVLTSNRDPSEWLAMMADPLLAQSAVDRLVSTAHELIGGDSYRRRQKPNTHTKTDTNLNQRWRADSYAGARES